MYTHWVKEIEYAYVRFTTDNSATANRSVVQAGVKRAKYTILKKTQDLIPKNLLHIETIKIQL